MNFSDLIEHSRTLKRLGSLNKHPQYPELVDITSFLPIDCSVSQRLWHIHNNLLSIPVCVVCKKCEALWNKEKGGSYRQTCSAKCSAKNPQRIEKIKQTNIERYDCASPFGNKSVIDKSKKTIQDKYGVNNISQLDSIKEQKKKTCLKNNGYEHPGQNRIDIQNTNIQRYGSSNYLTSEIGKQRTEDAYKERFNGEHPSRNCEVKAKKQNTNIERYGKPHSVCKDTAPRRRGDDTKKEKLVQKYPIIQHQMQEHLSSQAERDIEQFITTIYDGEIITNTRSIISPLELDIYIPEFNFAIEYCGVFWHSEQQGKDRQYHKIKYQKCNDLNIQLLTIFSDEWEENSNLIKQTILHKLKLDITTSVYARNCKVTLPSKQEKSGFLNQYHIQGNGRGSVTIGLEHQHNIVALMTFIKRSDSVYELNRYATSRKVTGGFSKLLNAFINSTPNCEEIISFADLRWSAGNVYDKNGFKCDKVIPPDYYYSLDGRSRSHKFNFRRNKLKTILDDFDVTKSEWENCRDHNILRIWDCGKKRYVLTL